MEVKKYYSFFFLFFLFFLFLHSCDKKNDNIFYLNDLAKDINHHNYTSKYNFSDFYISCQNKGYFIKVSYKEIYNDFYLKKDSNLTAETYLSDLFDNGIKDKNADCISIDKKIHNLYNKGQKEFLEKTSFLESDSTRILKNENINFLEVETILYYYSKMGYQINNNDNVGITILYKPNR